MQKAKRLELESVLRKGSSEAVLFTLHFVSKKNKTKSGGQLLRPIIGMGRIPLEGFLWKDPSEVSFGRKTHIKQYGASKAFFGSLL